MWTWFKRLLLAGVMAFLGIAVYDAYKAGLHTRPEMPPGAFSMSFKNGLRAIVVGVPEQHDSRRYLGAPVEVPFYFEDSWSFCYPPNDAEKEQLLRQIEERNWPGERLEAICKIELEEEKVWRGIITSVPKL